MKLLVRGFLRGRLGAANEFEVYKLEDSDVKEADTIISKDDGNTVSEITESILDGMLAKEAANAITGEYTVLLNGNKYLIALDMDINKPVNRDIDHLKIQYAVAQAFKHMFVGDVYVDIIDSLIEGLVED